MTSQVVKEGYTEDIHWDVVSTMKVCWNILICMWIGVIRGAVHANDEFELTSSPLTATDGDLFTLICSIPDESAVNIGWQQNNKAKVVTQKGDKCTNHSLEGQDIINLYSVSCSTTAHNITFRFSSTTDQGSVWQCGKQVSDYDIHPRSNNYTTGTEEDNQTSSPVMSTQSLSSTTRYMETTSDPEAETLKQAFTGEKDPNLLYIVVGAVGGAVLLTVVVVGVVCIRRRRKAAHQQNNMKEERNNKTTTVYQNTSDCYTVGNDLYEGSDDVQPRNAAENQEDDFMLSDAYATVDMPVTNTCTPREEVPSGDVNLENLYAKPDKSKHTEVQHVSDIYAEVQKPKKKKQDPMVSEV